MEDNDRWKRDISMVFDNYEDVHNIIRYIVENSPDRFTVSNQLSELYDSSIDRLLRETPDTWLGHRLIREMCFGIPQSVFDELAYDYWAAFEKEAS